LPVHQVLFLEPNPQPTKAALSHKGRMQASVRAPLVEASDVCKKKVVEVLAAYEAGREAS
jgi:dihydrodipicolinate synthase/N-acetylneuraminate lyase